jgi:hypothetical protein
MMRRASSGSKRGITTTEAPMRVWLVVKAIGAAW